MKKQEKRLNNILDILREGNAASTRELAQKLNVTEMTIRRDLNILASKNEIRIIHGGAIYTGQKIEPERYQFFDEETRCKKEKESIGKKAASLIQHGDTIILDGGSTAECVARYIPADIEITILCYSLNVINIIYKNKQWRKFISGGYFNDNSLMFEDPLGVNLIKSMRASKAFISATGVNSTLGLTCKNIAEVETKKAVIVSSYTKILIVDSTKFGKVHIAHFADLDDFDIIITDNGIPREYRELVLEKEITLYTV